MRTFSSRVDDAAAGFPLITVFSYDFGSNGAGFGSNLAFACNEGLSGTTGPSATGPAGVGLCVHHTINIVRGVSVL